MIPRRLFGRRYVAVVLVLLLLALFPVVGTGDAQTEPSATGVSLSEHGTIQGLDVGAETSDAFIEQQLAVSMSLDGGAEETIRIDTADVSEIGTIRGTSVDSDFDAEVVSQSANITEIRVRNPGDEPMDGPVTVSIDYQTDTILERDVTFVVTGERSGDRVEGTYTLPGQETIQGFEVGAETSGLSIEQKLNVLMFLEGGAEETIRIDTSEVSEVGTIRGTSVDSDFDAEVVSQSANITEIRVRNPSDEPMDGPVTVSIDYQTDTILERNVTVVVTGERSGDRAEGTFTLFDADRRYANLRTPDDRTEVIVEVRDPDGNQLTTEGVEVWAEDRGDAEFTITGGALQPDGRFLLRPESNNPYDIRATAVGYGTGTISNVEFEGDRHDETLVLQLEPGATISGTVTDDAGNPVDGATVQAFDNQGRRISTTSDGNGAYQLSVSPGNHSVRAFRGDAIDASEGAVVVESATDDQTLDLQVHAPDVVATDVEHVGGTEPEMDELEVRAQASRGFMFVQLGDGTGVSLDDDGDPRDALTPTDLGQYGADETTELELTLTVEHYDPDSLLWAANDVAWETEPSDVSDDAVDITVRTRPVHIEMTDSAPFGPVFDEDIRWPAGDDDVADRGVDHGVQFALFELTNFPPETREVLGGMTVTTNAQAFGLPTLENGDLSVYVGAPSKRLDGDAHSGFYTVHIPDSLLEKWHVEDPESDLAVRYQGESASFDVEDVEDGVRIHLDPISYSDGVVTVQSTADPPEPSILAVLLRPTILGGAGAVLFALAVLVVLVRRR